MRQRRRGRAQCAMWRTVVAVAAALAAACGCGRMLDLPQEPDATGGPAGEIAYVLIYAWDGIPALGDIALTRGQVLYGVDPSGQVRSWFSDTATPRPNPGRDLALAPVVAGDTLRDPVQICEGRNGTLWVAYARPRPAILQWNVAITPHVPIDTALIRDSAFMQIGGIAADADSDFVYVSDTGASRITKHAPSASGGRRITTLAPPGTGDFSVQQPRGIYAFGDSLLVADTGKSWLQVISLRTPRAGRGQVRGTAEEPLLLRDPHDVWIDVEGFFYVSDTGNSRVLKLTREGLVKEVVTELDAEAAVSPSTIAATDTRVWVVDPQRGRLSIYKINTRAEDSP